MVARVKDESALGQGTTGGKEIQDGWSREASGQEATRVEGILGRRRWSGVEDK
jgi:hypothetical protein